ncbi:MAG: VOC family protein [Allosphingosinicella sp.]
MSDTATAPETRPDDRSGDPTLNRFFWYELMTPDQDAAVEFYNFVVGWTVTDQMTDGAGGRYLILSTGGRGVGGVMGLNQEMQDHKARPSWLGYIHVDDTDAAVNAITGAGGKVYMGPQDIPDVGRFAMVADPGGAPFYVMSPSPRDDPPPPAAPGTPGHIGWHEQYSSVGEKAAFAFYSGLFGWKTETEMDMGAMGKYRIFSKDGVQLGGMMDKPEDMPASSWTYYINVDGIDAAVERIKAKDGQVLMGPESVPGGSWIVQAVDPQGASFALVSSRR